MSSTAISRARTLSLQWTPQALMAAATIEEVEDVFEDPSKLKVVPLLQYTIFASMQVR